MMVKRVEESKLIKDAQLLENAIAYFNVVVQALAFVLDDCEGVVVPYQDVLYLLWKDRDGDINMTVSPEFDDEGLVLAEGDFLDINPPGLN